LGGDTGTLLFCYNRYAVAADSGNNVAFFIEGLAITALPYRLI
jgi:hypothetical protein